MRLLIDSIRMAMASLLSKKTRSFLSMLGIIIGILTVSGLLSLAFGVRDEVENQINSLGSNVIAVTPGNQFNDDGSTNLAAQFGASTLTEQDFLDIKSNVDQVSNVSAAQIVSGAISSSDKKVPSALIWAGTPGTDKAINLKLDQGRLTTQEDEDNMAKVAVIGIKTKEQLYGNENPIGKTFTTRGTEFVVVGTLQSVDSATNFGGPDLNAAVMIPLSTGWEITGTKEIARIMLQADSQETIESVKKQVEEILLKNHKGEKDFTVLSQDDILEVTGGIFDTITALLGSIAAISLLVGGIGIMNIMLVSVSERTREIGIRKAVGATQGAILLQFLIESVILTILAGLIAVLLFSAVVSAIPENSPIPISFNLNLMLMSLGFSAIVGIIFGVVPAIGASRKNPIDALRYE